MKITAFQGSPHAGGSTAAIIDKVLEAAAAAGAETSHVHIGGMDIAGCTACFACRKTGKCAIDDDMQAIYTQMEDLDAAVLGFPIYFFQMNGQTKNFIDRLYAQYTEPGSHSISKNRPMVLIATWGAGEGAFDEYVEATKQMLQFVGWNVVDVITVGESHNQANSEIIADKAAAAGRKLAEALAAK